MHNRPLQAARAELSNGGNLLVTRLRHVGDVILTLPLLAALRNAFPEARLHYLTEAQPAEVLSAQPELARCWIPTHGVATLDFVRSLRAQRFAAVLDLFSNPRSALLVRATGSPLRVGEGRRGRRRLYTVARTLVPGRSAIAQHLGALEALGVVPPAASRPILHLRDEERVRGEERLHAVAPSGPRVVVHLGASQPAKEWPTQLAVAFGRRLLQEGARVIWTTSPLSQSPSAAAAAALGDYLPPLSLREFFAVLAAADLVVSVDGATVHAAVALGTPTLALFGPTDPRVWFPYVEFGPFEVLHAGHDCTACDREHCPTRACMSALDPALALSRARRLLDSRQGAPRAACP